MHNRCGMKVIAQALVAGMVAIAPIASARAELDPDKLSDLVDVCERAERAMRDSAPAPFKISDLVFVFNAFIRKQPAWRVTAREEPALALVAALQDSWPCPNQ